MTLKMVQPGTRVIVQQLTGEGKIKRRLMDMGIVPGTEMEVQKIAPLGDPVEVKFKGYNLSLRREEAGMIQVSELVEPRRRRHGPRRGRGFGRRRRFFSQDW
jgi:Fe2+ transport system protein FeoA